MKQARIQLFFIFAIILIFLASVPGSKFNTVTAFNTITVTTTADDNTVNGNCTLREAILAANTDAAVDACAAGAAGLDTIVFALGAGTPTINVTGSALPSITNPVVIDGATGGSTRIELNGTGAGAGAVGLTVNGGASTVRALVINHFTQDAIQLNSAGGNTIENCYLGLDAAGVDDLGNGGRGINIDATAPNNVIGGISAATRNVIAGNTSHGIQIASNGNQISGNVIGLNAAGTVRRGNSGNGIHITGNGNTVGGLTAGERNVVAANEEGVYLSGANNTLQGNYLGTDVTGTTDLGNAQAGVIMAGSANNNLIGGTAAGAGNVIAGNNSYGIYLSTSSASMNTIQGNIIGLNASGTTALGNSLDGIFIAGGQNNVIGGTSAAARNVISGNLQNGVRFTGSTASGNQVLGNYIGLDSAGAQDRGNATNGIHLDSAPNNTIGGMAAGAGNLISGNDQMGVRITGAQATGNLVQGNYIGTDVTGTLDRGNTGLGVYIVGAPNNTVGGTAAGARNLISGNNSAGVGLASGASGNLVQGNFIGTDVNGTAALGNTNEGVGLDGQTSINNTIGGTTPAARNVISGNNKQGVFLFNTTGNLVQGNYIGVNATGAAALPNLLEGVSTDNSHDNTIGGAVASAGNVISGNGSLGVRTIMGTGNSGSNLIQGNFIGTNAAGTSAIGNSLSGIGLDTPNNTIGGTTAEARNVISGNTQAGVIAGRSGNQIQGNYIGTNAAGTASLGNGSDGVRITGTTTVVGGTAAGARNVIAGNTGIGVSINIGTATDNRIEGNYIGTNAAGTGALPNASGVSINLGTSNVVGGTLANAGNLIAGNTGAGVILSNSTLGNRVEGNFIGLNAAGTAALANGTGVSIYDSSNNTIGGTLAAARNLISANTFHGIEIIAPTATGNQIQGNYIGTDVTGNLDLGNGGNGLQIYGSNNIIGGATAGAGNLISGNTRGLELATGATGNQVRGNIIGLNAAGAAALGNSEDGVLVFSANNIIGGTSVAARNLVSGNDRHGVHIEGPTADGNQIQGNYIGTDATGALARGNSLDGVFIYDASNNTVGGTAPGAGNVISANGNYGVRTAKLTQTASNNVIQGNFIGTEAAGNADLGNGFDGVALFSGNNTVGGTAAGARNVISGNGTPAAGASGVVLYPGAASNTVQGNYIGTNAAGTAALANSFNGVQIRDNNNLIGGATAAARNVISGNTTSGVFLTANAAGNQVHGNYIGVAADGTSALGNGRDGVTIGSTTTGPATGNHIGSPAANAGNLIAFNLRDGIRVTAGTNNPLFSNSIFGNTNLGIDLGGNGVTANDAGDADTGPNDLQNFPVITTALTGNSTSSISGTLNSTANVVFNIQLYSDTVCDAAGNGEGRTYLAQTNATTDGSGNASFNVMLPMPLRGGSVVTATATDGNNNTSEFSACATVGCTATITLDPASLPNGLIGDAYNQTFVASGGVAPYSYAVSAGSLPPGLSLSSSGVLAGTATGFGTFNFSVRATDANNCSGTRAYTLVICNIIAVNPTGLANGFVGTAYHQTVTASGGTAPYTFALSAGMLPGGLSLNANTGVLSGTPTMQATFTFIVRATDVNGCTGTRAYTVIISGNGLMFYPLPAPVRLLDTRPGASPNACSQPNAPIAAGSVRTQPGRNFCTIPATAAALTGNVTTVDSGGGFLTLYPSDAARPTVASTNFTANEIINNVFTVGLGLDGAFNIYALTTTEVVVDVTGYYAPPATNGLFFHALPAPVRLLETRLGFSGCVTPGAPLPGGVDSPQQASTACTGIPATARAIVGNATTVSPQGQGYLTLFPGDALRPLVASSNYNPNQIVNGPFSVGLAATGEFKIYTTATTDLVVDVLGYYSPEVSDANGAGLLLTPLAHPIRLLETRPGEPVGCFKPGAPLTGQQEYTQAARGLCDGLTVPVTALGVVGNATVVQPLDIGFLTLWPSSALRPLIATSNYNAGDIGNRHFIVGLGQADGAFKLYSHATTHLVIDLSGYFAP